MQEKKVKRLLGAATLLVWLGILYAGLWPYNISSIEAVHWIKESVQKRKLVVLPPNEVNWRADGKGLHFGDYGSIFSDGDFAAGASDGGCTFEVWLEPEVTEDLTTTLAFSRRENPLQFRLRQLGDSLSVSRNEIAADGKPVNTRLWVEHVFKGHEKLLITLASGADGTSVYLNGKLRQRFEYFRLKPQDFTGRFVFGNSPLGHETWGGELRGMVLYGTQLTAAQVERDYAAWSADAPFAAAAGPVNALYLFHEGSGSVIRSAVRGAPELIVPDRFQAMRPKFLEPFWEEFEPTGRYALDTLLNIVAFVPLGFLLRAFLTRGGNERRALLLTILAGFLTSLAIEVGQYYLPMRNSGTTDLITNTLGTTLGALLYGRPVIRGWMVRLAGRQAG